MSGEPSLSLSIWIWSTVAGSVGIIIGLCRWLEWAPVNVTVHLHNYYYSDRITPFDNAVPSEQESS